MLVSWDDDHAVGYDMIDAGHRLVIETINRLNAATTPSQYQTVLDQMLTVLIAHLTRQFEHEDAQLNSREHAAEHGDFLAVLKDAQGSDVPDMLLLNLISFLGQHLRGTDRTAFAQSPALAA